MKKLYIIFIALFLLSFPALGGYIFASGNREFSENENRMLKTRDQISFDVLSGDFQKDIESYLSDQFPGRDGVVTAQTRLRRMLGRTDAGGAYFCGNGRLMQKITDADVDVAAVEKDAGRYARLAEKTGKPVTLCPVPSAGIALPDLLPTGAPMYHADALLSLIRNAAGAASVLDLRDALSGNEAFYYKTDHHWTSLGAYEAYRAIRESDGKQPAALDEFGVTTAAEDFRGSLFSKAPDDRIPGEPISIAKIDARVRVTADGEEITFYDRGALQTKDKYNVFLAGNHGIVIVENPDASGGGTLLLIKDSFANSLMQFLVHDYGKIIMIDERYAAVNPAQIAAEENVDEILVVKELSSF